jgi:hypothetical protein
MIRKLFIVAVFSFLLASFVTQDSFAAANCPPGCDCETGPNGTGIMGAMENHAEAIRVQDKAIAQQVIKQNDNALGMTCFDRSVGLTSRLGQVFSDKIPEDDTSTSDDDVPVLNTSVFTAPVYDENFGVDNALLKELQQVIEPTMEKHVKNFDPQHQPYSPPLSAPIGGSSMGFLQGLVTSLIDSIFGQINFTNQLSQLSGYIGQFNSYYSTLQTALGLLGTGLPSNITTAVAAVNAAWSAIQSAILTPASTVISSLISDTFNDMTQNILGDQTSLNNVTAQRPCSRIDRMWSPDPMDNLLNTGLSSTDEPIYKSLTASGPEKGVPYLSVKELLEADATQLNNLHAHTSFLQAISNNAGNDSVLEKALDDINPIGGIIGGPSTTPGALWQTAPWFPANSASTSDVINAM